MNLWNAVNAGTHLLPGEAQKRRDRDREYLMSLTPVNLLRSHYLEAGLIQMQYRPDKIHWGWDSPMSQIRGTFCGHWLSAAAHMYRDTHDEELLARAEMDDAMAGESAGTGTMAARRKLRRYLPLVAAAVVMIASELRA